MNLHLHVLALALAVGPATFAHAQYMPQNPNAQQDRDRTDHDRDDQRRDTDDQNRYQGGSISNLQNSIHQAIPNSNIMANLQDRSTIVLTGAVATQQDRQYAEQIARQQAPNMRVIDQITIGNVGAYGNYPGSYGNNGTYNNGAYGNNGASDRDHDRDNAQPQGTVAPGARTDRDDRDRTDVDRDRVNTDNDRDRVNTDNDRDRDNRASSDRDDQNRDRDKDKDKHGKKDKDKKHKKDKDKKDNDDRDPH